MYCKLQHKIWKTAILLESGEGTKHDLRYLPTKNSPVQTLSNTNNKSNQSGGHGFTEAKRALLKKVMVLLRPDAIRRLNVHNNNYLLRNNNIQQQQSLRIGATLDSL